MELSAAAGVLAPRMRSTDIALDGTLTWNSQDVTTLAPISGQPASLINISSSGSFNISAASYSWGSDPSLLNVTNAGTLKINNAGQARLGCNYVTSGRTQFVGGSLIIGGSANQTGGSFELSPGTTIVLAAPPAIGAVGVLGIRNGTITGTGSVQGSLVLGDPTPNLWNPVIAPISPDGGSGVILVTGDLQIFNGRIQIGITGPSKYDRVNVGGYADVTGIAVGILQKTHDAIPANTQFPFLTSSNFKNDFTTKTPPADVEARVRVGLRARQRLVIRRQTHRHQSHQFRWLHATLFPTEKQVRGRTVHGNR